MMARTITNYLRMLQSLLPKGRAWNRAEGSVLTEFLTAMAAEFVRVETRVDALLKERDTRTTTELLGDFEVDLGLPDECSDLALIIQRRRRMVHSKTVMFGRQDKQYFIDLAASLGYTVTITEGAAGTFQWYVNVSYGSEWVFFRAGGSISSNPLVYVPGSDLLECILNLYKPAHTLLELLIEGAGFDYGFDSGFVSFSSSSLEYLRGSFERGFNTGFDVRFGGPFDFNGFDTGFDRPA